MSDININIISDEESEIHMNVMETVPVGKYEEKINKVIGGNMPITLAHKENPDLVNDVNYPSLKYLAECFEYFRGEMDNGGAVNGSDIFIVYMNGDLGLNDILRINSCNTDVDEIIRRFQDGEHIVLRVLLNGDIFHFGVMESMNDMACQIQFILNYGKSKYFIYNNGNSWETDLIDTEKETDTKISNAIGDVETALENIIAKYGLGGDAS